MTEGQAITALLSIGGVMIGVMGFIIRWGVNSITTKMDKISEKLFNLSEQFHKHQIAIVERIARVEQAQVPPQVVVVSKDGLYAGAKDEYLKNRE